MRGYLVSISIFIMTGLCSFASDEVPDWSQRYQSIKAELISEFPTPKVGDAVTISRRVGGDLTGRLSKITKNSVTVNGRTYKASSLTKECCRKIFAEVSVPAKALKLAKAEKAAYEKSEEEKAAREKEAEATRIKEATDAQAKTEAAKAATQKLKQEKEDQAKFIAERLAEANNLKFKGLRLGMHRDDIEWLVQKTGWKYRFESLINKKDKYVFLSSEPNASVEFKSLASKGLEDDKIYYEWRSVYARFHDEKVYIIEIDSQQWSANYIDSSLKTWLQMAHKALSDKYGKPTKTILAIDDINIFSFKTGYNVFLCKWRIKDQCVALSIGESESEFYGKIHFIDLPTEERIESQTKVETLL